MAGLTQDSRTGNWLVPFRYGSKKFLVSSKTTVEKDAHRFKSRIEETLGLIERGHLVMPPDADPKVFIVSAGKLAEKPKVESEGANGVEQVCKGYIADQHGKAESTLVGERVHINHLKKTLGATTKFGTITTQDLQEYVNKRAKKKFRGKPTSGRTIRKELITFTQIWGWAKQRKLVRTECPVYDDRRKWAIKIAKPAEREKFQTWDQITKRIQRGKFTNDQKADLWSSLFLDNDQVLELLEHVKKAAKYDFIYPMFMFVAYAGVRRSEMRRSRIEDFDFETERVMIREKKRKKTNSESYRFVDLHPRLAEVMKDWFKKHPGGEFTISAPLAMPSRKTKTSFVEMTPNEAHHHFEETLENSKWDVVRGFHVLRHSFGANLARANVKGEQIAEWMGHTTAEMMRLYQHLFPQDAKQRIAALR